MVSNLSRPKSVPRRLVFAAAIILVTGGALGLALYARQFENARQFEMELPPLSLEELTAFEFNPYLIGYLFEGIVIPALFIYLFSSTKLFRRVITGEAAAGDSLRLFVVLTVIQLLVLIYDLGRFLLGGEPPPAVLGLLVVVTGGLLGGWRVGLGLGLVVMFFRGTQQFVLDVGEPFWEELRFLYQMEGMRAVLVGPGWDRVFFHTYLLNLWASAAVWAGVVAGLCAELLEERRFGPLPAFGLGAGIDLGAGYLTAVAGVLPGVMFLIPSVLVSGVAMAAVALMVRNVQAEVERRKAEATELALARAELRALRAQINPHFLFNALNTIRYFVRTDAEAARRLLLNLSEVFQRALRSGEFVPLRDELSYVEAYLALEQARLDRRLRVQWSTTSKGVSPDPTGNGQGEGREGLRDELPLPEQPVPTLILQPIVENAVIHGIAKKAEGGTICIAVAQRDGDLVLSVEDDGPGIAPERLAEVLAPAQEDEVPAASKGRESIGLRNVDGRLRALYGEEYGLLVESQVGRGTRIEIRVPVVE